MNDDDQEVANILQDYIKSNGIPKGAGTRSKFNRLVNTFKESHQLGYHKYVFQPDYPGTPKPTTEQVMTILYKLENNCLIYPEMSFCSIVQIVQFLRIVQYVHFSWIVWFCPNSPNCTILYNVQSIRFCPNCILLFYRNFDQNLSAWTSTISQNHKTLLEAHLDQQFMEKSIVHLKCNSDKGCYR